VPFALSRYAYNDGTSLVSVKNCKQNTFISLAARFGIFSYVHAKISQDPSLAFQRGTPRTVGILQAAIFPTSNLCLTVAGSSDHETGRHWHPMSSAAPLAECCPSGVVPNVDDARHYAKRLQIIRLLFSLGVEQTYMYPEGNKVDLRAEIDKHARWDDKNEFPNATVYYAQVAELLGRRRSLLRSANMWFQARKS